MDYAGRVAVITGAASGIGRGLALEAGRRGMRVAIADIDESKLADTLLILREMGVGATSHVVNVADSAAMENLADEIFERHKNVHVFFNNAGVHIDGSSWSYTDQQWRWLVDINVFGVVNGVRAFLPRMISGGEEGIIANTASLAGLISFPYSGCYCASKHAVVGFIESVHFELCEMQSRIRMAMICPGAVATAIATPPVAAGFSPPGHDEKHDVAAQEFHKNFKDLIQSGMSADDHAKFVFEELENNQYWVISDDSYSAMIEERLHSINERRSPRFPSHI